jgi:hypothetical protein
MGWHHLLHQCLISLHSLVLLLLLLALLPLLQAHCLVAHSVAQPQGLLLLLCCQILPFAPQLQ